MEAGLKRLTGLHSFGANKITYEPDGLTTLLRRPRSSRRRPEDRLTGSELVLCPDTCRWRHNANKRRSGAVWCSSTILSATSFLVVHCTSHFTDCSSHHRRLSFLCCRDLSLEQPPGSSPFFRITGPVPKVTENGTIRAILFRLTY